MLAKAWQMEYETFKLLHKVKILQISFMFGRKFAAESLYKMQIPQQRNIITA